MLEHAFKSLGASVHHKGFRLQERTGPSFSERTHRPKLFLERIKDFKSLHSMDMAKSAVVVVNVKRDEGAESHVVTVCERSRDGRRQNANSSVK